MKSTRAGSVAGAVALTVLAAACGSGGDGDAPGSVPAEPEVTEVVEVVTEDRADAATADEPEADSVADEVGSSLPANIWPEEIVETGADAPRADAKDVVTLAPGVTGAGIVPEGVDSITARVTSSDGEVCEVCLWLADDDASRQRGLMDVTDLGGAVGMAFLWEQPRTGNFFMFQTPTPLSIAWFDAEGSHVGQADMEPCLVENSATCERYTADEPYVLAVEMFGGQLDAIGIGPGSAVELLELDCV